MEEKSIFFKFEEMEEDEMRKISEKDNLFYMILNKRI